MNLARALKVLYFKEKPSKEEVRKAEEVVFVFERLVKLRAKELGIPYPKWWKHGKKKKYAR